MLAEITQKKFNSANGFKAENCDTKYHQYQKALTFCVECTEFSGRSCNFNYKPLMRAFRLAFEYHDLCEEFILILCTFRKLWPIQFVTFPYSRQHFM